jgi:hypothetical protein
MRFLNVPAQASIGQTTNIRIGGIGAEIPPEVTIKSPGGRTVSLTPLPTGDPDARWSVAWTPDQAGNWEMTGRLRGAYGASAFAEVIAGVTGELARSAPAIEALGALAGETGGKLLNLEPPTAWLPDAQKEETKGGPVVTERRTPLWNSWTMLLVALSFYAAELVFRRLFKLL